MTELFTKSIALTRQEQKKSRATLFTLRRSFPAQQELDAAVDQVQKAVDASASAAEATGSHRRNSSVFSWSWKLGLEIPTLQQKEPRVDVRRSKRPRA